MLAAFFLALRDIVAPAQRRALISSLLLALAVFVAMWVAAGLLLRAAPDFGLPWLDYAIALLGSVAALVLTWLLFPMVATLCLTFFLDEVVATLARQYYPDLPPARPVGTIELLRSTLGLVARALTVNLAALPFYLWPAINLFIYYGLNGYLLGREYFELVALHRLDRNERRATWYRHRGRLVTAGVVIAVPMSLPFVNLVAPLLAAVFMLHVFEGARRRGETDGG